MVEYEVEMESSVRTFSTGIDITPEPRTFTRTTFASSAGFLLTLALVLSVGAGLLGTFGSQCPQCGRLIWWHYLPKPHCYHCAYKLHDPDWYYRENWYKWWGGSPSSRPTNAAKSSIPRKSDLWDECPWDRPEVRKHLDDT